MPQSDKAIVLQKIQEWNQCDYNSRYDGVWYGYPVLECETGIPVKEIRRIYKELRHEGKIQLETAYNMNGQLSGSGYFLADV